MQPRSILLPEIHVAGLGTRFISILSSDTNLAILPTLWQDFMKQSDAIPHKVRDSFFGVMEMLPDPKSDPMELFYIAAAQVTAFQGLSPQFVHRTLPAARYALFTHKGKLDRLAATMNAIYKVWLPQSGEKLRPAPHLEWYDKRFQHDSDQSEFDILLPV